ncbi:MAG: zinc-dependent metalloprotease family protein [Agrococcus casei]|uniref:zinc-dependent metalloprotease family protein n=1 Tax=Agrococcus casei TaxID=343512 RepID=UPI003F91FBA4
MALPAQADEALDNATPSTGTVENKYQAAAGLMGTSEAEVKQQEDAGNIVVTDGGVVQVDPAFDSAESGFTALSQNETAAAQVPGTPEGGSNPGAPLTIFLDFDGHTFENQGWNDMQGESPLTFAGSQYTGMAADVWASVVEDYAPFNVNVTTTDPGADALYKTSADDNEYGVHVVITDSYDDVLDEAAGSSGLAFIDAVGSDYLSGALVFTAGMGDVVADSIAFTASHEAGHNFGLGHDGHAGDDSGYYYPSEGLFGPIMGAPYGVPVSQWSNGDYNGATNTEDDDVAMITDRDAAASKFATITLADGTPYSGNICWLEDEDPDNPKPGDEYFVYDGVCHTDQPLTFTLHYTDRASYIADAVGNNTDSASALSLAGDAFDAEGVIIQRDDLDVYELNVADGEFTATLEVADIGANLNASILLTDADGNVVAEDEGNPVRDSAIAASGLGAEITATDLTAGVYYLTVDGVGFGDPSQADATNAHGFSDYGSLGHYALTGTAVEPQIVPVTITAPADGSEFDGGYIDVTGTGTIGEVVEVTVGDETVSVTVGEDGTWATTVAGNQYGDTTITATQAIDDSEASVTVTSTAVVEAPVVEDPADGTTDDDSFVVNGTGIPGATVTVTILTPSGETVVLETTVDADGNWSVTVENLEEGQYVVSAKQAVNGASSEASDTQNVAIGAGTGDDGTGDDDGEDDGDPELPETGFDLGFAGFGLMALLLLGGGALVLNRRFTTES